MVGDISKTAVRQDLINKTIDTFGKVDILIYSAGAGSPEKGIYEVTEKSFDDQFGVNCRAPFFLVQGLVPHLEATKGNIVLISSVVAMTPQPYMQLYSVGKHIMDHMAKCMAVDLGPKGKVNL